MQDSELMFNGFLINREIANKDRLILRFRDKKT